MGPTTFAVPDVVGVEIAPTIRYRLLSSTTESRPACRWLTGQERTPIAAIPDVDLIIVDGGVGYGPASCRVVDDGSYWSACQVAM
jgi:hypothetical protein